MHINRRWEELRSRGSYLHFVFRLERSTFERVVFTFCVEVGKIDVRVGPIYILCLGLEDRVPRGSYLHFVLRLVRSTFERFIFTFCVKVGKIDVREGRIYIFC